MTLEKSAARLLVEGPDDKWTVINLLKRHGFNFGDSRGRDAQAGLPFIQECGGVDLLFKALGPSLRTYPRLGVILDADHPPVDRWAQLRGQLARDGVTLPDTLPRGGAIADGHRPDWKLGVWVMPDNHSRGMLEDFLATLVPAKDACWPHALAATDEARRLGAPLNSLHVAKGAMHAWLAWQDPSGQPFGQALQTRALRHDAELALTFLHWFERLFDVKPAPSAPDAGRSLST